MSEVQTVIVDESSDVIAAAPIDPLARRDTREKQSLSMDGLPQHVARPPPRRFRLGSGLD